MVSFDLFFIAAAFFFNQDNLSAQGLDQRFLSYSPGLGVVQKLPGGGRFKSDFSYRIDKMIEQVAYRQIPQWEFSVHQPLGRGFMGLSIDPEREVSFLTWKITKLSYQDQKNTILVESLKLMSELAKAMGDSRFRKTSLERAQKNKEQEELLNLQGRRSKIDFWRAEREALSAHFFYEKAVLKENSLRKEWRLVFDEEPPDLTFFDPRAILKDCSQPCGENLLRQKILENQKLLNEQKKVFDRISEEPLLQTGLRFSPNIQYSSTLQDAWTSVFDSRWTMAFSVGFTFLLDYAGIDAKHQEITALESENNQKEIDLLNRQLKQEMAYHRSYIQELKRYGQLLKSQGDRAKMFWNHSLGLFQSGQITEFEVKEAENEWVTLQSEITKTTWEEVVAEVSLLAYYEESVLP